MNDIFKFSSFSSNLFILLLGFVFGNLFPTFCGEFLGKAYILILISLESFNYFYYSPGHKRSPNVSQSLMSAMVILDASREARQQAKGTRATLPQNPSTDKNIFKISRFFYQKSLKGLQNSFKLGFLFGLFVDAFKVGS
jgi:Protein of unknown function (DUF565)